MSNKPRIKWSNWEYQVVDGILEASHAGEVQMRLPLAPLINGKRTLIEEWSECEADHFIGRLDSRGTVHLACRCGHVCFWMETEQEQFDTVAYFPGTTFNGRCWQTYMSDEHDRQWDVDIDQEVGISTSYEGDNPFGPDGQGMTDTGDFPPYWIWTVPLRAFAVRTGAGWVGFSIPGALPVGLTRFQMNRGKLFVNFDILRPSCHEGAMPRVYLATGISDPYDLLDEHRIISDNLGLTVEKDAGHPSWWGSPEFGYWDEYMMRCKEDPEAAAKHTILTSELWLESLRETQEIIGVTGMKGTLEQGCFNHYGDYRPTEAMGGVDGVRAMIDELRAQGTRVGHYIHPYRVNTKCDFWREHPEAFCKPKNESHETYFSLEFAKEKPVIKLLDWTHPAARDFIDEQIRFMLSDEPGCLNCDILRGVVWVSPDPSVYEFHDPDWGIGDLMTWKVQRHIYESAKRIKPDCMVAKHSIADPYLQPWADVNYLCEEWNGYTDNWYRRGRIATRITPTAMFVSDSYFVTLTKGYEYYMGMNAWNMPQTTAVRHAIHPYTHYRKLAEKDFKRRNAGFHAALNAPPKLGDVSRVNILPDGEVEQWRKYGAGRLSGFYAAIGIGKRTLVTFSDTEARIATSIARTVEFPLPPDAHIEKVEMVPHEGSPEPWDYTCVTTDTGPGLRIHLEDCGKRALYYRVKYRLRQTPGSREERCRLAKSETDVE